MKRTNRMAALALGGLLALSLTACGGKAPAGGVEGALEKLRAAESMEASAGELDLAGMYGELGDLEIAVWVDQESGCPARCSIDMTAIMQAALEKSLAADSEAADLLGTMTMDKISMVIDCSNFNQAADFDIPAEALAAAGAE